MNRRKRLGILSALCCCALLLCSGRCRAAEPVSVEILPVESAPGAAITPVAAGAAEGAAPCVSERNLQNPMVCLHAVTAQALSAAGSPAGILLERATDLVQQMPASAASVSEVPPSVDWTITGWTGDLATDFPLAAAQQVDDEQVRWLNSRILQENVPLQQAPQGASLDGNPKHASNYGTNGVTDCVSVTTSMENQKNGIPAGVPLQGKQEFYGYSLAVSGISAEDPWHVAAEQTGKAAWQCTWWAWGRAAQYVQLSQGKNLEQLCCGETNMGNGKDYYQNLSCYFVSDQTPRANSIVSWSGGTYGHVAYVEAVDDKGIWISHANSGYSWRGVVYVPYRESGGYQLGWYGWETCLGFNHLDQPLYG